MRIDILNKSKKDEFLEEVSYLGKFKLPHLFIATGGETIRVYSGGLSSNEVLDVWRNFPIEGVGLYFGKKIIDKHGKKESRLSLDALHLLKKNINNHIIEINKEQMEKWFLGDNIELTTEQKEKYKDINNFVAVKYEEDFIGTAKLNSQYILMSFLPKERRVKRN